MRKSETLRWVSVEKRREKGRIVANTISFLLNRITFVVIAIALVLFIGGRFELASASQPNAELEIQKLTSCYALGTDAIGRGNLLEGKNIYRRLFYSRCSCHCYFS
ncbi:hypothetical protein ANSO36C_47750 [Nostoc cf. commune SO-36]|uniref:Uncharacterized protein n=1 Tax=Nostoc cf. commune SO-36 TaxID=449208 RepID=A0ABN6Q703_NOSCO|nr:hypothetical protein [Nostoc commune]BDI18973.1 hypothetical protein ANSO36C_47750 [Nostoc cf. commune SO-36]